MTDLPIQTATTKRVLIVDDARIIRSMLKTIFTKLNILVVGEAVNGQEAVQIYDELKPDLVTMDITMPGMDGLTAARNILARHPGAKIIMITSLGQEIVMREAIRLGALDFIVKPFEESRIISAVQRVLPS